MNKIVNEINDMVSSFENTIEAAALSFSQTANGINAVNINNEDAVIDNRFYQDDILNYLGLQIKRG